MLELFWRRCLLLINWRTKRYTWWAWSPAEPRTRGVQTGWSTEENLSENAGFLLLCVVLPSRSGREQPILQNSGASGRVPDDHLLLCAPAESNDSQRHLAWTGNHKLRRILLHNCHWSVKISFDLDPTCVQSFCDNRSENTLLENSKISSFWQLIAHPSKFSACKINPFQTRAFVSRSTHPTCKVTLAQRCVPPALARPEASGSV